MSDSDPSEQERHARFRDLSAELEGSSEAEVLELVAPALERGSAPIELPRSGARVFVKLLPLCALELEPANQRSTANLFGLPPHYHYRIGSAGLGSWRELEVHRITTEWVLSGLRPHFPLLYGWRVLPIQSSLPADLLDAERWGDEPAIQRRVDAISAATTSLALFLEHFPQTLSQWLQARLESTSDPARLVKETEARLRDLLAFTRSQGLLHMDAHFENVLTEGSQLYLSDFGLAISEGFRLDAAERAFFARHGSFDLCTALTSNVHAAVAHYGVSDDWREPLRALLAGAESPLDAAPADLRSYLAQRGPVAVAAGDFYRRLGADLTTEYPEAAFRALLEQRSEDRR